ncbi:MAG TPA: TonB-dependent receptor, partial [Myxococcaceae bacterium]|nr:TonB-dependent receptor [Myxococcaceae bacterium]
FGTVQGSASASGPVLGGSGLLELHAGHSDGDFPYVYDPLAGNPASNPQTLTRENNQATWVGGLAKGGGRIGPWRLDGLVQVSALSRGLAGTIVDPTPDDHQDFLGIQAGLRLSRAWASGADTSLRLDARREGNTFRGRDFSGDTRWWQASLSWDGTLPVGNHWLAASASVGLSFADSGDHAPRWAVTSASVQDEWRPGGGTFSIAPSARIDQAGPFVGFSPKLGVSWALPAGVTLQANVGQSYRIPSFVELYIPTGTTLANPDLEPERGVFVDAGVGIAGVPGMFRVAGFAAQYENLIVYEYQPPVPTRPENLGAVRAAGLEAEGRLQPAGWVELTGSYGLLFTENIRAIQAFYLKEAPYRPRHRGTLRLRLGPERIRVHTTMRAQSLMWLNRSNTQSIAGRVLVDAGVDLMVLRRPELVLSFNATNLGDVQTRDLASYPLPGRAFLATLAVRLDLPRAPPLTPPSVSFEGIP